LRPRSIAERQAATQGALDYYANLSGKPKIVYPPLAVPRKRVALPGTPPKEHAEQVAFVRWFRRTYTGVLIFAIPNGSLRDSTVGFQLKAEGVTPDVPDLLCPKFHLFIEMKRVGGSRKASQKLMGEYLVKCGYGFFFAMGAEDAKRKTIEYLSGKDYGH
jgi:hypothetical protein